LRNKNQDWIGGPNLGHNQQPIVKGSFKAFDVNTKRV